jgi:serine/threonine protein kinase
VVGAGLSGEIYLVTSTKSGKKKFIEKVQDVKVEVDIVTERTYLGDLSEMGFMEYGIPVEVTEWANKYQTWIPRGGVIIIPIFASPCKTVTVLKVTENKTTTIPVGSYICNSELFPEFAIASLCGQLYSRCVSVHFLEMYNFTVCEEERNFYSHTFMELADGGDLNEKASQIVKSKLAKSYVLQVLQGIAAYQSYYEISHNDLHLGNILLSEVKPETKFNGETLYDADWYQYHFLRSGTDLYLPATPFIPKIADFGRATKWSPPIVADGYLFIDGFKGWIPMEYIPQYDSLYFLAVLGSISGALAPREILGKLGLSFDFFREETGWRPKFAKDDAHSIYNIPEASAINILQNPEIAGEFMERPSSGKIVILGVI